MISITFCLTEVIQNDQTKLADKKKNQSRMQNKRAYLIQVGNLQHQGQTC